MQTIKNKDFYNPIFKTTPEEVSGRLKQISDYTTLRQYAAFLHSPLFESVEQRDVSKLKNFLDVIALNISQSMRLDSEISESVPVNFTNFMFKKNYDNFVVLQAQKSGITLPFTFQQWQYVSQAFSIKYNTEKIMLKIKASSKSLKGTVPSVRYKFIEKYPSVYSLRKRNPIMKTFMEKWFPFYGKENFMEKMSFKNGKPVHSVLLKDMMGLYSYCLKKDREMSWSFFPREESFNMLSALCGMNEREIRTLWTEYTQWKDLLVKEAALSNSPKDIFVDTIDFFDSSQIIDVNNVLKKSMVLKKDERSVEKTVNILMNRINSVKILDADKNKILNSLNKMNYDSNSEKIIKILTVFIGLKIDFMKNNKKFPVYENILWNEDSELFEFTSKKRIMDMVLYCVDSVLGLNTENIIQPENIFVKSPALLYLYLKTAFELSMETVSFIKELGILNNRDLCEEKQQSETKEFLFRTTTGSRIVDKNEKYTKEWNIAR